MWTILQQIRKYFNWEKNVWMCHCTDCTFEFKRPNTCITNLSLEQFCRVCFSAGNCPQNKLKRASVWNFIKTQSCAVRVAWFSQEFYFPAYKSVKTCLSQPVGAAHPLEEFRHGLQRESYWLMTVQVLLSDIFELFDPDGNAFSEGCSVLVLVAAAAAAA